ncbi:MAG: hypothetical protein ABI203_11050 [Mucilaginibacter sp.]
MVVAFRAGVSAGSAVVGFKGVAVGVISHWSLDIGQFIGQWSLGSSLDLQDCRLTPTALR